MHESGKSCCRGNAEDEAHGIGDAGPGPPGPGHEHGDAGVGPGHACCHGDHGHGERVDPASVPAGTQWTCPMHPEVIRDAADDCPICGMALEPMVPTLEEGPNEELIDLRRRLWISAVLTVPLVVIAMRDMLPGGPLAAWAASLPWVELCLATPVVWWGGS